jgi:hypothetical protein
MNYIFCYWDDPVDYRHDRETKDINSLPNIEQKQETSNHDSGEYERRRRVIDNQKKTNNPD